MNTNSSTGGKLSVNISKTERIVSVLAGSVLVYKGLQNEEKKMGVAAVIAGSALMFRGATGHCHLYTVAGKHKLPDTVRNINIVSKFLVRKPRQEVYNFWRSLSNLPLFMEHLKEVKVLDEKTSHWVAKVPGGLGTIEWDAEIVKEVDGYFLGWNSLPHATINNAGKVEFADAFNNETEITVVISYRAPLGDIGEGVAALLNPLVKKTIEKDILNFKNFIEGGSSNLAVADM